MVWMHLKDAATVHEACKFSFYSLLFGFARELSSTLFPHLLLFPLLQFIACSLDLLAHCTLSVTNTFAINFRNLLCQFP